MKESFKDVLQDVPQVVVTACLVVPTAILALAGGIFGYSWVGAFIGIGIGVACLLVVANKARVRRAREDNGREAK